MRSSRRGWASLLSLQSTCRKHLLKDAAHLLLLLGCEIPVHSLAQSRAERSFRLPAHQFFRQRVICDAIYRASGHIWAQADVRLQSGKLKDHLRGVDHSDAFHRSEINCGTVVDFFSSENCSADDVIHIGPIADLRAIAPDIKRILPDKSARDHCYDIVILQSARSV